MVGSLSLTLIQLKKKTKATIMACKKQALLILFLSLFTFSTSHPDNGGIAVYWGQDSREGDLKSTCDSGKYAIVVLGFLSKFGAGRTPVLNFAGHCGNGSWKKCTELEFQIKHCQAKGIRVLLSIGGASSEYSLISAADAKTVANYLFSNFLSGQYGPLGAVTLDGIDFSIENSENHWDVLAAELDSLRRSRGPYFFLSGAVHCSSPAPFPTDLFEYIFVKFFNNPTCAYSNANANANATPLLNSWDYWVNSVLSNNSLFLGLPATSSAVTGYIPSHVLKHDILPHVKKASNYEGVVLWDRHTDNQNGYSASILFHVLKTPLISVTSVSDAIYQCVSKVMNRAYADH
ncbi:hypothetical protein VNO78_06591 [Psophocarpus tetragonolobus]|uniref:GH18 domain-containing protein n=1 Tax=Psophocarpus tetragonolobus TaxID=3891 RepID=A0AAN9STD9_PSOTE